MELLGVSLVLKKYVLLSDLTLSVLQSNKGPQPKGKKAKKEARAKAEQLERAKERERQRLEAQEAAKQNQGEQTEFGEAAEHPEAVSITMHFICLLLKCTDRYLQ